MVQGEVKTLIYCLLVLSFALLSVFLCVCLSVCLSACQRVYLCLLCISTFVTSSNLLPYNSCSCLHPSATAIAVDQVTSDSQTYDVIFLGFDDGKVRKIGHVKSSTGSWESKVIETIQVAVGEPIVKLEVLGNNDITKRLLFVVSDSKVSQLPLHRCDRYTTCR